MDPNKHNGALVQGRDQATLVSAGRLEGHQRRAHAVQPGGDRLLAIGDALDPRLTRAQIEPIFGNIDTDNRLVCHLPTVQ